MLNTTISKLPLNICKVLAVLADRRSTFMTDIRVGPVKLQVVELFLPFPITPAFYHTEFALNWAGRHLLLPTALLTSVLLRSHQEVAGQHEISSTSAGCLPPENRGSDGVPQIEPRIIPAIFIPQLMYIACRQYWLPLVAIRLH